MGKYAKIVISIAVVSLVLGGYFAFSRLSSRANKTPKSAQEIIKKAKKSVKNKVKERPISARKAYKIAKPYGKKWAQDAVLIDVANFIGDKNDGLADIWIFSFSSSAKGENKGYKVTIADEKFSQDDTNVSTRFLKPVEDNWIDSDVAAQKAKKYFEGLVCKNYWYGLTGDTWKIKCSKKGGGEPKWVELNALTGEFIKTWEDY